MPFGRSCVDAAVNIGDTLLKVDEQQLSSHAHTMLFALLRQRRRVHLGHILISVPKLVRMSPGFHSGRSSTRYCRLFHRHRYLRFVPPRL